MRAIKFGCFGVMLILFLGGCNECEECESIVSAPRTSFVFINQTSLDTLNLKLAEIDTSLAQTRASAATLNTINDSLKTVLDTLSARILRGMIELREDSTVTANTIAANNSLLEGLTTTETTLTAERTPITSTISTIQSGSVLVDTVTNLMTGESIWFTDSASVYKLPLDPGLTEMSYGFSIASRTYEITISYVTTTSQNARRNVVVGAESIQVSSTTFNNAKVEPESNNTHATAVISCDF